MAVGHTELEQLGDADKAVGICELWDGIFALYDIAWVLTTSYGIQMEIFGP